jgi:hypothetical protein
MPKPPESPPSSDLEGVHQDGTGPSRPLPSHGQDGKDLGRAADENKGRPAYHSDDSGDDRTG